MIKQEQGNEDSPKLAKIQGRRYLRTPKQQPQQSTLLNQLHSANPILPPGIHKQHHEGHQLKYRYLLQKSKLNKTTFPEVRSRNWLNHTQTNLTSGFPSASQSVSSGCEGTDKMEEQEQDCQFGDLVLGKVLVYCRMNNRRWNRIDRDQPAFYCSFFVNVRKEEIKSRKVPAFQYMPRIYKDMKPSQHIQDILKFNSSFQSGNLFCALRSPSQPLLTYQLYMQNDINTKGCTQWFYFSAWAQRRAKVRFKIMNFYKPTSLFMIGMKILVSCDQVEWKRVGTAVKYYRVGLRDGKDSYCLQFIYEIQQPLNYGYPYTYSHLENVLGLLSQTPLYTRITIRSVLCQTFLGNNVHVLTISNHLKSKIQKPIIYIIARQHPGETPGSFMVEGMMRTLLSNRIQMEELRDHFVVKVFPMVNVDGVVNGNYRSNFSGNDVNRQWLQPSRKLHPEIYTLKQEIISNKKNVHFFLDLHAHSRKMNSFFYGSKGFNFESRLYPFICSKLNKNISFTQCSFVDDPTKKTTARVVIENEANVKRSLTFQASFYGYEDEAKKTRSHFKEQDLKGLGQSLALGLYYSQIGAVKYSNSSISGSSNKNTAEQQKTKKEQIENSRNSVSCHLGQEPKKPKKSQIYGKIERNCARIMQKWKKQLEKYNKQDDDVISQGSSLNPEHFELSQFEEEKFSKLSHQEFLASTSAGQKHNNSRQNSVNPEAKEQKERSTQPIKQQNENEQDNGVKGELKHEEELKDQMKMSFFPVQSNLRNSLVVKKLQSELQMQRTHRRYESFRSDRDPNQPQKLQKPKARQKFGQIVQGQRFKSIQVQTKQPTNYKNNIIQMKRALKYFMENKSYDYKSSDYDDYKAYLKYSTNGATLIFSDRDSVARIKKKYNRV